MTPRTLDLKAIRIDGDTQSRIQILDDVVADYAELIRDRPEWPFPNLTVFNDGKVYWLADGFHRFLAATRETLATVQCDVHQGTAVDARIFGMKANDKHGQRPTRADRRANVEWLLDNEPEMKQQEIADCAGVSRRTVCTIVASRAQATEQHSENVQVAHQEGNSGQDSITEGPVKPRDEPPASAGASEPEPGETAESEGGDRPAETGNAGNEPPGFDSKPKPSKGKEVSAAPLVDKLFKDHIGHISRGLSAIAIANGDPKNTGEQFKLADDALNQMIEALRKMREGQK